MKLFYHNEINLVDDEIILLRKVSLWFVCEKTGGVESPNFDFHVVNFDTMKLIFCAIMSEALISQGFLDIEKERKLQYRWYHNFRSYVYLHALNNTRVQG